MKIFTNNTLFLSQTDIDNEIIPVEKVSRTGFDCLSDHFFSQFGNFQLINKVLIEILLKIIFLLLKYLNPYWKHCAFWSDLSVCFLSCRASISFYLFSNMRDTKVFCNQLLLFIRSRISEFPCLGKAVMLAIPCFLSVSTCISIAFGPYVIIRVFFF